MHLVIDEKEFKRRITKDFPFEEGDTFVTQGMRSTSYGESVEQCLKRYRFTNGKLKMEKDFIKNSKDATKKQLKDAEKLTDAEVIQWCINYRTDPERNDKTTTADYQIYTREFSKRFEFFYSIEGFSNPYDENDVAHAAPNMKCSQKRSLDDHLAELERLLPYFEFTEMEEDIGKAVHIDIFEWTCSENGCYNAYIKEDGSGVIMKTAYHHTSKVKDFDNYVEMIAYMIEHLPYERENEDDDDGDDYNQW